MFAATMCRFECAFSWRHPPVWTQPAQNNGSTLLMLLRRSLSGPGLEGPCVPTRLIVHRCDSRQAPLDFNISSVLYVWPQCSRPACLNTQNTTQNPIQGPVAVIHRFGDSVGSFCCCWPWIWGQVRLVSSPHVTEVRPSAAIPLPSPFASHLP